MEITEEQRRKAIEGYEEWKSQIKRHRLKRCTICGRPIGKGGPLRTCGPACRAIEKKALQRYQYEGYKAKGARIAQTSEARHRREAQLRFDADIRKSVGMDMSYGYYILYKRGLIRKPVRV